MVNESYVSEVATLLDRFRELTKGARKILWTGRILVDERELLTLVEQLKHAMPQEVQHAQQLLAERQNILYEARAEAETIRREAKDDLERLADNSAITAASREKAEQIVAQARAMAQEIHQGSREYADNVLSAVEGHLNELLKTVQHDRAELRGQ